MNVNKDNTIEVQLTAGNRKTQVSFDILLICTGFLYDSPIKTDGIVTIADRKKNLQNFYNQIKSAKNIAVVGGGIVGVELAGEIAIA